MNVLHQLMKKWIITYIQTALYKLHWLHIYHFLYHHHDHSLMLMGHVVEFGMVVHIMGLNFLDLHSMNDRHVTYVLVHEAVMCFVHLRLYIRKGFVLMELVDFLHHQSNSHDLNVNSRLCLYHALLHNDHSLI